MERSLLARGVSVEHADRRFVMPVITLFDSQETVEALVAAIIAAVFREKNRAEEREGKGAGEKGERDTTIEDEDEDEEEDEAVAALLWSLGGSPVVASEEALPLREAFFAAAEVVPAVEAPGRFSAETICPYPPGVPVLAPGEVITAPVVKGLQTAARKGLRIAYASDPTLRTFRVLKKKRKE